MLGFGRGRKDGINPRLWKLRENALRNRRILLFSRNKPQCVRIVLGKLADSHNSTKQYYKYTVLYYFCFNRIKTI